MADGSFRGILYVMDSLRYDALGCHGGSASTPTMDRLAAEGIDFEQAFSQAIWTYPSAGSIFTGLYPETHDSQQFDQGLNPAHPHLADGFAETPIETACFSTTLGVSPERGFAQEFDEFYHIGDGDNGLRPDIMDQLTDRLIPWLKAREGGFFAVIWAMGTHHPYLTPDDPEVESPSKPHKNLGETTGTQEWMRRLPTDRSEEVRSRYDTVVSETDSHLGAVVETLEQLGVYDQTQLIATADHGELFDEHARVEHGEGLSDKAAQALIPEQIQRYYGLFDRSAFVGHQTVYPYDELIHVPLLVKPGLNGPPATDPYTGLVELVDILPTIYQAATMESPAGVQGESLWDQLDDDHHTKSRAYSTSRIHGGNLVYRSVRDDQQKFCRKQLVEFGPSDFADEESRQSVAAYLLGTTDLLMGLPEDTPHHDPDHREQLATQLDSHVQSCLEAQPVTDTATHSPGIEVDDETVAHLEDLGYQ